MCADRRDADFAADLTRRALGVAAFPFDNSPCTLALPWVPLQGAASWSTPSAARRALRVGDHDYTIYRLDAVAKAHPNAARLPFSLKILLENLLRTEDGLAVRADDIEALANWDPKAEPDKEIAFTPARVLLQDFTGVPAVVDLAAMRDAMKRMGGDPKKINPLQPAELVIDHSVQVDDFGNGLAFRTNADLEFSRNRERYAFLRWGQKAFRNFKVVPPDTGIVHQVNLEYLARVVFTDEQTADAARRWPIPTRWSAPTRTRR